MEFFKHLKFFSKNKVENNSKIVGGNDNSINNTYNYNYPIISSLPNGDSEYIKRKDEDLILNKLKDISIVCICGISGCGKTSTAISIANKIKKEYSNVLYIDGEKLKTTRNMEDIYIEGKYKIDLETILVSNKTLLVIDNVYSGLDSIIRNLENMNLIKSKVIITTQILKGNSKKEYFYKMRNLDINICRKILFNGIDNKFNYTDINFDKIIVKVSYNPLMLKILNTLIKDKDIEVNKLCSEVLMEADDIDEDQSIKHRIMKPFLSNCLEEIELIYWINTTYVDKDLLIYMLNPIGFKKLKDRFIFDEFNSINKNTIKIHDLILEGIKSIVEFKDYKNKQYEKKMIDYFIELSEKQVEKNNYYNALYMHKDKIIEINKLNKSWGIEIYLLLKSSYDYEFDYEKWEKIDFSYLTKINYNDSFYFQYISVIEFLERKIFKERYELSKEKFFEFINDCINNLNDFLDNDSLSERLRYDLLHHLGKLYIYIKEYDKAINIFENIVNKKNNSYSAKLQLIRLYQKKDGLVSKSKIFIKDIFAAYNSGENIDITVVLAVYQELIKKDFEDEFKRYVLNDIDSFSKIILESSNFYFDMPFRVFVKVGKKFSYNKSNEYKTIANNIPMKVSEDINDNELLFSIGEFYKDRIKNEIWSGDIDVLEKNNFINLAEKYYKKMKKINDFQKRSIASFYICANMPGKSLEYINKIKNKNQDPFNFYYESQAFELIYYKDKINNYLDLALESINKCIEISINNKKYDGYLCTFYRQKAIVLNLKNDNSFIKFYEMAINSVVDEKFKKQMIDELDKLIVE